LSQLRQEVFDHLALLVLANWSRPTR
jgi:hypothetical protein